MKVFSFFNIAFISFCCLFFMTIVLLGVEPYTETSEETFNGVLCIWGTIAVSFAISAVGCFFEWRSDMKPKKKSQKKVA